MKKTRTAQQVQMIQNNDVDVFEKFLATSDLTHEATKYLFENGTPKMKKVFLKVSYPQGEEFVLYQKDVVRYADRKTLATYYMYHDLTPESEIELIKRNEVNPFLYYTSGHQLSEEALRFLFKQGSTELANAFLSNDVLDSQGLTMLLKCGNMDYICLYMATATGSECEEILNIVKKMNDTTLLSNIYKRCYGIDFVL